MKWYILAKLEVYRELDSDDVEHPQRRQETVWQICQAETFSEAMKDLENWWGDDIINVQEMIYLCDSPVMLPVNSIEWIKENNDVY